MIPATKLHPPELRTELVSRSRLVAALAAEPTRKLTLVGAPAGSGKTTVLCEWHSEAGAKQSFAWLSLDREDNDPVRFWECVIEALRTVEPGIGAGAVSALRAPGTSLTGVVVPLLINELAELGCDVVVVLDDYHLVSDERIHDSVAFLLDRIPATTRLAIATRSDPPLPLARLRARGDVTEVRAEELRFSGEEATKLFNDVLAFRLDESDIERLLQRTEGWAAGLQLAGISLRGRRDVHAFISTFAGDDRQIVDYLLGEVLAAQPEALRTFMLRTSILDRLCSSLCDAVTGSGDSATMLAELERANLFVVPLDSRREWYRYHHLFGELLRHELERAEPELGPELHHRAGAWHREHGLVSEAIGHAIAADDVDDAVELIAHHWPEFLQHGRLDTVADWLAALPRQTVLDNPRLALTGAWLSVNTGRLEELDRWVEAAERSSASDHDTFEAASAMLRCVHRYMDGDVGRAIEAAEHALALEREETPPWRSVGCPVLGIARFWHGETAAAVDTLERAVPRAKRAGNNLAMIHATAALAAISAEAGDFYEAERLALRVAELSEEFDLGEHWATAMAHIVAGKVREHKGRVEQADAAIARGVELSQRGIARVETAYGLLSLARLRHARGRPEEARALLREARLAVNACADPGILAGMLAGTERRLSVRSADGDARDGVRSGEKLSDRELAVLRLLPNPLSLREIGAELFVSLNTVKTHTRSIYRKLGAAGRDDAVERARALQLL